MIRRSACLAVAGLLVMAGPASGAKVLSTGISVPKAKERDCHERLFERGRGFKQRDVTAPATGTIQVHLRGKRRADWDLGVFDADGRSVAGSAHFGSRELAEGIAVEGQRLTVQACRRSGGKKGSVRQAKLRVKGFALPEATGENRVQLVRVATPTRADKDRLVATDLDLTEHGGGSYVDVVLHGADDRKTLSQNGFAHTVLIDDLVEHDRKSLEASHSSSDSNLAMPSGQENYRRMPDYSADLKQLADDHPELVKPITLPHLSLEGRPIEGVEITKNPDAADGKPVFLQMGLHHAREWPSGEHAIEWAYELVNNYGTDERTTRLVDNTRTIVVPVVNPDGFNLTREVPFANETLDPLASEVPIDSAQPVVDPGFAYKRRNCRMLELLTHDNDPSTTEDDTYSYTKADGQCRDSSNRRYGVDPNRNYGGFWGGPGASSSPTSDVFWGEGPFSEPETQNIQWLVSNNQVTTLITNHTYSDLILRPPGVAAHGDTIDEDAYRQFGAEMAAQNGYSNWKGFELYDTTGTTEDWSYFATAGFGFTFEIGRAAQSLTKDVNTGESTSDLAIDIAGSYAAVGFHPPYPLGVMAEWHGKGPHTGKGNREAYYVAQEATLDPEKHSLIEGKAKPGTKLVLSKEFQTATSPRGTENGLGVYDPEGEPILFTDRLETEMIVDDSGQFTWHVNPSTRPDVLRGTPGRQATGPTSEPQTFEHDPSAPLLPAAGAPVPGSYEERDFTIASHEDNGRLDLHLEWPIGEAPIFGDDDLDLHLYRKNDLGLYEQIASSTNAGGPEDIMVVDPIPGEYRFRVENWWATNDEAKNWTASLDFAPPSEGVPGTRESWSLTCTTPKGKTGTEAVTVDRGDSVSLDLRRCGKGGKAAKPDKPKPNKPE